MAKSKPLAFYGECVTVTVKCKQDFLLSLFHFHFQFHTFHDVKLKDPIYISICHNRVGLTLSASGMEHENTAHTDT